MLRLLVIGDSHIPRRAKVIPSEIINQLKNLTSEKLFDYTFFTGDLIDAPDFLSLLSLKTKKDVFKVIGNMDYYGGDRTLPESQELRLKIDNYREMLIGMVHGHQISPRGDQQQLEFLAEENEYNILISGHTHKEDISLTKNGILLLNPGSVSGAWSFIASGNSSFIILEIDIEILSINLSLFQLKRGSGKLIESKSHFTFKEGKFFPI